jgi:hypothetical protein
MAHHDLLLRMAGRVRDDVLARGRDLLAEGSYHDVDALLADHWDLIAPPRSPLGAQETVPAFGFAPAGPTALAVVGERIGAALDLTGGPDLELADITDITDNVDDVLVAATAAQPRAIGLWRTWRFPTNQTASMPLARVFLVELESGSADDVLVAATGRLQEVLRYAGVAHPLVEAYDTGRPLPAYQAAARGGAALLWARQPWHAVRLARTFDRGSPPRFDAGHPVLSDSPLRASLLGQLRSGATLLASASQADDVVSGVSAVVPQRFHTDGWWIWTAAVAYYLDTYGLALETELAQHLATTESARAGNAVVDGVAMHRAIIALSR